jgi:hypothetical protein
MKRMLSVASAVLVAWSAQAVAQEDEFDVTFEVLDDVSGIDAVLLRLEERRDGESEDAADAVRETRDAPASERPGGDALEERARDRELLDERTERRENDIEDGDVEPDAPAESGAEPGGEDETP